MVAVPNAVSGGVPAPIRMAGTKYAPHWATMVGAQNTTSTRLYFYPIYLDTIDTWLGVKTFNGGAGDNGEVYRVGIYGEAAAGGPGALGKDFGEVTLSGASALRTLTSSFTNSKIGWHYMAVHHNSAASMFMLGGLINQSAAGLSIANQIAQSFGTLEVAGTFLSDPTLSMPVMYIDTTYGALASTAVTPTGAVVAAPAAALYK